MFTDYTKLLNKFGGQAVEDWLDYNPEIIEEVEDEVQQFFASIQNPVPYEEIDLPLAVEWVLGKALESELFYESETHFHAKVNPEKALQLLSKNIREQGERKALSDLEDEASELPWWAD